MLRVVWSACASMRKTPILLTPRLGGKSPSRRARGEHARGRAADISSSSATAVCRRSAFSTPTPRRALASRPPFPCDVVPLSGGGVVTVVTVTGTMRQRHYRACPAKTAASAQFAGMENSKHPPVLCRRGSLGKIWRGRNAASTSALSPCPLHRRSDILSTIQGDVTVVDGPGHASRSNHLVPDRHRLLFNCSASRHRFCHFLSSKSAVSNPTHARCVVRCVVRQQGCAVERNSAFVSQTGPSLLVPARR